MTLRCTVQVFCTSLNERYAWGYNKIIELIDNMLNSMNCEVILQVHRLNMLYTCTRVTYCR